MNFLITNDDGYDAPGLAALYTALQPLGNVRVVAPAVCHSAKGHAVTTHNSIRVRQQTVTPFGPIQIVDATPADCIRIGLCAEEANRPDFVVAGINPGANLGVDLFYSGTAAAAREASILGVPALAVSRYVRPNRPIAWDALASHVTRVVGRLISDDHKLPAGQFWNVNFPAIDGDHHPPELTFARQSVKAHEIRFQGESDPEQTDVTTFTYVGDYKSRGRSDDCDVSNVFADKITATPVDLCTTADHPSVTNS